MSQVWDKLLTYLAVFAVGGFVCLLAQILVIKTKITPARILVIFLLLGVALEATGAYKYIFEFAKSGIAVPIVGFGAGLTKGAAKMAESDGILGAIAGGLTATAYGVGAAVIASYLVTLIFSPRTK